jgi:serine/alanine adding enzyme
MSHRWHYEILTTNDRARWRSLMEGIPHRDIFFMPEYVTPFERLSREVARLFFFGDETNCIVYPFFQRRINDLPFYRAFPLDGEPEYFDIVSPYGYSGPLACVRDQSCQRDLWQGYLSAFHHYCQDMNIVCEFARLNPFMGNQQYLQELTSGVQASNQITYLDLTQSEEALWRGFKKGNRYSINKARRSGVTVDKRCDSDSLRRFYELYLATMRRNQASRWYDFSLSFFMDGFTLLDDKISLFCASYEEQIIAASLFLHDGDVVHYFLSGSDGNYLALCPNNLLLYQAICWAKRQGYRLFNLGGGYKEGLARFKASFSKLSIDFYTYRMVHNARIYDDLCQRYAIYNSNIGQSDENTSFFPRYRAGT